MSWLNLKRLLPPKKLWKLFSKKIQFKLHKLNNRCKANKKPKIQSHKTTNKLGFPSLSIQPKQFKVKKITNPHTWTHDQQKRRRYNYLQKRAAAPPIYVDQLFIKPISLMNEISKEESCSSSNLKEDEIFNYQKTFHPESCKERRIFNTADDEDKNMSMINSADDLWESLFLASPQMHGINERAEEFIARFRAEMQNQETLAFNNMHTSP